MRQSTMIAGMLLFVGLWPMAADAKDKKDRKHHKEEESRLDVPVAKRGLTIGKHNLMLGLEPGLLHEGDVNAFTATVDIRYGITRNLEVYADPIVQSVDPILHDPDLGAMYRFSDGDVEVAGRVAADLALFGKSKFAMLQAGVPFRFHAGNKVAFDVAADLLLPLVPDVGVGFDLPVGVDLSPTRRFFITAASGVRVPYVTDMHASLAIPLSVGLGTVIAKDKAPAVDLGLRGSWDDVRAGGDFSALVTVKLYLYP